MTEPNLLKQAKAGDPASIAALMNHSLRPKGIQAKALGRGDRLFIRLEAQTPPDQALLTKFVRSGIHNLNPASFQSVEVSGQAVGSDRPVWTSVFELTPPAQSSPSSSPPSPPPPPPPAPPRLQQPASPPRETNQQSTLDTTATEPTSSDTAGVKTRLQGGDTAIPGVTTTESENTDAAPPAPPPPPPSRQEHDTSASFVGEVVDDIEEVSSLQHQESDADWSIDADEGVEIERASYASVPETSELSNADAWDDANQDANQNASQLSASDEELHSIRRSRSLVPTDVSGPLDFSAPASSKTSVVSNLLFVAVLLVLVGVTGGLVGYALWSYFEAGGSIDDPGLTTPEMVGSGDGTSSEDAGAGTGTDDGEDAPADSQMTDAERLQEAAEKAESATTLAQSAQSGDDWSLVANQWRRAIEQLESIPETSPEYGAAQQQLATYRNQLAAAQQRADSLANVSSAPLPSTVVATNQEPECEAIATSDTSQPLELSAVRFADSEGEANQPITGCITNHGEQAIASVTVEYTTSQGAEAAQTEGADPEPTPAPVTLQFSDLEAGATVPFTASLPIPPDQTNVQITRVIWTPAGASEPQSLEVSVSLSAAD